MLDISDVKRKHIAGNELHFVRRRTLRGERDRIKILSLKKIGAVLIDIASNWPSEDDGVGRWTCCRVEAVNSNALKRNGQSEVDRVIAINAGLGLSVCVVLKIRINRKVEIVGASRHFASLELVETSFAILKDTVECIGCLARQTNGA